ncbi:hypothetical protein LINPERHAP2_LOCUS20825 [Linum perenne]
MVLGENFGFSPKISLVEHQWIFPCIFAENPGFFSPKMSVQTGRLLV